MDLTSQDVETTPPTQPTNTTKSLPLTNGTLKRHPITTTTPPPPQPPSSMVVLFSYKECLKNHAASIGGHALDGCGEFMPSSSTNPNDPRSLKCAACGCHRNFHRRDPLDHTTTTTNNNNNNNNNNNTPTFVIYTPPSNTIPPPQPPPPLPLPHRAISQSTSQSTSPSQSPSPISSPSSPPPLSHLPPSSYHTSAPHMLLALGNAYSTLPSDDQHQHHQKNLNFSLARTENMNHMMNNTNNSTSGKKRYRTKFSKEQKEKMQGFSEKLGWRMNKSDDGLVQKFCNEIGVSRGVFKVWMHNNKNSLRKRSDLGIGIVNAPQNDAVGEGSAAAPSFHSEDINNNNHNHPYNTTNSTINNNNGIHINEDNCVDVPVSMSGMSS